MKGIEFLKKVGYGEGGGMESYRGKAHSRISQENIVLIEGSLSLLVSALESIFVQSEGPHVGGVLGERKRGREGEREGGRNRGREGRGQRGSR